MERQIIRLEHFDTWYAEEFMRITNLKTPWLVHQLYTRGHYRLLTYIVNHDRNADYFDAGMGRGASFIAMLLPILQSTQATGHVYGCDVEGIPLLTVGWSLDTYLARFRKHGTLNIGAVTGDMARPDRIAEAAKCRMVMIDGQHNGVSERLLLDGMLDAGFTGIVVMDDTTACPPLTELAAYAAERARDSWDLTEHFHETGTYLFDFGNNIEVI